MSETQDLTRGYKGNVVFFKYAGMEKLFAKVDIEGTYRQAVEDDDDKVYLGEGYIEVDFITDTRSQEIACFEKLLASESAKFELTKNNLLGRIRELQALEHVES